MYQIEWKKRWQGNDGEWIVGICRYTTEVMAEQMANIFRIMHPDNCYNVILAD